METAAAEAAQIAHAANVGNQPSDNDRDKAIADLALITGASTSVVTVDQGLHLLRAPAAPLPGLGVAGYRTMERRAIQVLNGWNADIIPPEDAVLPTIQIQQGIMDDDALNVAAWASKRMARSLSVNGGTLARRQSVAKAINERGGNADVGAASGRLRLTWPALAKEAPQKRIRP